jgi:ribosomal protein S18 acetylase RimI-like enzyme
MEHVLDNPAWNALISGNKHLAFGDDRVKYFDKAVSPFAAFKENTKENLLHLYNILPEKRAILLVTPTELEIPAPWKLLRTITGLQMVYHNKGVFDQSTAALIPLTDEHIPQMLELTKLTEPGPFAERTIDFGQYFGIFAGDRLVAMTGQRLYPFNYAEVSAVCTHPDHTGKGYARQLMINQINIIRSRGETPFLHVRDDNERAIKVYESLGFSVRTMVYFYVIIKD